MSNTWVINIICGIITAFIIWVSERLTSYFSKTARWERYRYDVCKKAIYSLDERYNISCSSTSIKYGPYINKDTYIMILYELICQLNNDDTTMLSQTEFETEAKTWYNSWHEQPKSIEVYSMYEITQMLVEVNSWGLNKKPSDFKLWLRKKTWPIKNWFQTEKEIKRLNQQLYTGWKI